MHMIKPITVDNTAFISSNIPENDYPVWAAGTAYTIGDRVIVIGTVHQVYECTASNTGNDPTLTGSVYWVAVSATNRWKAFDSKLADVVTGTTSITYSILTPIFCDNIAFFRLNAATVQVVVKNTTAVVIYDVTVDLTDTSSIVDWFTFYIWPADYSSEVVFENVPAYAGYTVEITVSAATATTVEVGEIAIGKMSALGTTLEGTTIGTIDFSRKERDTFGNAIIIERAFSDTVNFRFAIPVGDTKRVKSVLDSVRAKPAVYYAGPVSDNLGTTIYGYHRDLDIPLSAAGISFGTLTIEGLT